MSTFNETITLTNAADVSNARRGLMPQSEVRSVTVKACVDTGSWFLVLNEETRAALGLQVTGAKKATLADGTSREYAVTEPVEFRWKDRRKSMEALVVPNACYPASPDSLGVCACANSTECFWVEFCHRQNSQANPHRGLALFGALCMEALDVMADPVGECLVGRHGDEAVYQLY